MGVGTMNMDETRTLRTQWAMSALVVMTLVMFAFIGFYVAPRAGAEINSAVTMDAPLRVGKFFERDLEQAPQQDELQARYQSYVTAVRALGDPAMLGENGEPIAAPWSICLDEGPGPATMDAMSRLSVWRGGVAAAVQDRQLAFTVEQADAMVYAAATTYCPDMAAQWGLFD